MILEDVQDRGVVGFNSLQTVELFYRLATQLDLMAGVMHGGSAYTPQTLLL